MLLGFLAATGTLFAWSLGTMSFLRASRMIDPGLLNRARLMLAVWATLALGCITTLQAPWTLIATTAWDAWFWLGMSGIVGLTIGDLFGFTSLRILGAKRQSVIGTIAPAASALAGLVFLDERISFIDFTGITITLGGVVIATTSSQERHAVHAEGYGAFTVGLLLAIGGAVCQGVGLVLAKKGMQLNNGTMLAPFHATFLRMSVGFSATYALDIIRRAPHRPLREAFAQPTGRNAMLMGTLFGPITGVTLSLLAAQQLPVAIAQTIFSLVPFVVMGITRFKYNEPLSTRSIAGAIVSVCGVLILVLW